MAEPRGRITLVGGGPGAEDLITVRGLDRLLAADVVVTDRLAPTGLLQRLGENVEIIDAARGPDSRKLSYDEIVGLMIQRAGQGKHVVRLKGGDPFVFAHGAQEVASCTEAGVAVEVVPGVSSATAAAGFAGFPLTHVEGSAGFSVVSGHLAPDDPVNRVDWSALARSGTSIVILMGMRQLAAIADRLIAEGVPTDTEAVCVADASLPTEQVVRAELAALPARVAEAGLANPAVIYIEAGTRRKDKRILILGGSRSGKSGFAERLAEQARGPVRYLATSAPRPDDPEWLARVERHRRRRPDGWATVETPDLPGELSSGAGATLLVDSITTWLAAAMHACGCWAEPPATDAMQRLLAAVDLLIEAWSESSAGVVAVSDEVGSGVVPATSSGRLFRDVLGEVNQRLAAGADEVWLVTAGIPSRLK